MSDEPRYEMRDGRLFRVVRLPDAEPPKPRSRPRMPKTMSRAAGVSKSLGGSGALLERCVRCKRELPRVDLFYVRRAKKYVCASCRDDLEQLHALDIIGRAIEKKQRKESSNPP